MSFSLQKRVKHTDGSLTCLQSIDLEGKETFNCLITYPAAQSYRSRPPQLPFIALRMKAVFGRGDLRTKGLQILPCLCCPCTGAGTAPTLRGVEGTHSSARSWGHPCTSVGTHTHTHTPLHVCKTIFLIFWLAWQITAAPSPELLSTFAQVPIYIQ